MHSPQTFVQAVEVRFRDLDSLGHINNAVYLSYLEHCRVHWLLASSLVAAESLAMAPLILARTEIDFVKPGFISDQIFVKTWLASIGHKSFQMLYEVASEQQGILAKAKAVLVWFDYEQRRSVPIPPAARRILEQFCEPIVS